MRSITIPSKRKSLPALFLLAAASLPLAAPAQHAGPMARPAPGPQGQPRQTPPIRVRVDLVSTPVIVRDSKGELVLDLNRDDFRVFDNGIEQSVAEFDMGGAPLSVVILVETSSRIEPLLPAIRRTGILFTQSVVGEDGQAALISYNDSVDQLLDFTSNRDLIEKTMSGLTRGTSGAKLYDALSQAVRLLEKQPPTRRRVIVALAEAADTGSEDKLGDVMREAQLANITVYTVGLSSTAAQLRSEPRQSPAPAITPPGTFGQPPRPGTIQTPSTEAQRQGPADILAAVLWLIQHVTEPVRENSLELAAAATGGLYQAPVRDNSIETSIDRIAGELHAQYTLAYRPASSENGYHEIKVTVDRPGMTVRTRPGYYLGVPEK